MARCPKCNGSGRVNDDGPKDVPKPDKAARAEVLKIDAAAEFEKRENALTELQALCEKDAERRGDFDPGATDRAMARVMATPKGRELYRTYADAGLRISHARSSGY